MNKRLVLSKSLPILVTGALLTPLAAQAVPSFARQTGLSCAMCHTVFPQLTPYGRMFKLQGYTTASGMFNEQGQQHENLQEDTSAPLSAMMQVSYTSQKAAKSASSTQETLDFPQQFSFFYAGRVSDHMGIFSQITWEPAGAANGSTGVPDGGFGMDNTDIRYANKSADGSVLWGVSLNNAPTVQDIYNSTPVWGFPSVETPEGSTADIVAAGGIDDPALDAGPDMGVAGLTAYAMWNNSVYTEAGMYHAENGNLKVNPDGDGVVDGWAPYYRLAYQGDAGNANYEVGLIGMSGKTWDGASATTSTKIDDLGIDGQYQILDGPTTATVRGSYITQKAGSVKTHQLNLSGTYYSNRTIGGTIAYKANGGDSAAGQDVTAVSVQADYLPYLNTKFALQYTTYTKLPSGLSKSDYNTLYLLAWFMY